MKVTQEKLPDSQIGLEIEVSGETTQKTYENVVQNLARSIQLPGFRKGKIPRPVLIQRIGTKRIKAEALEQVIQKGLDEAIKNEEIQSLGNYKLISNFDELVDSYEPGQALTFAASIDVPPTVTLGDYKNLSVTAEESAFDPGLVEEWLSEKQKEQATLVPVEDRGADFGDVVIVDYSAVSAETGEPLEDVAGVDLQVDMESGKFISGMVEGIVGMKPGDTKELPLTFPGDYPVEELANKDVVFTIVVKEVKGKELPELDDDFAQEVSEYETLEELRATLEERYRSQSDKEVKDNIHGAIIAALVEDAEFDIPETLIQQEITDVLTQTFAQMEQMGINVRQLFNQENLPKMRDNARPDAIARLKNTLAIAKVAELEKIELETGALQNRIDEILQQISRKEVDMERLREIVTEELLTAKTLDWLQENCEVNLVPKGSLSQEDESPTIIMGGNTIDVEATTEEE
ncbi:MAG: trigger factor [Chlorogloea purpurea SAG 13.99]|nr:trigger factor [Chlorogloea purpurea SAG 13.99]